MKIAHVSDLHICSKHKNSNIKKTEFLLAHLAENAYDHIVITGDITHNAVKKDFQLLRLLLGKYDLLDSGRVSLVIGNHDIFGGIHEAEDILDFPSICKNTKYRQRVKEFGEYYEETFSNSFHPNAPDIFPYVKIVDETVLIGINSIAEYSYLKNSFAAKGKIAKKEFKAVKKLLKSDEYSDKTKIILIHHHFYKHPEKFPASEPSLWRKIEGQMMKLSNRKKLLTFFESHDVKLILHGHIHENLEYMRNGMRILNAGSTFSNANSYQINYNLISIEDGQIECKSICLMRSRKKEKKLNNMSRLAVNM